MNGYEIEARREKMEGKVILGSKEGYSGDKVYKLEDIADALDQTNIERGVQSKVKINCIISPSLLVGRATESSYREDTYILQFSVSPRVPEINKGDFFNNLIEYATSMGAKLKQQRVYVDFDGEITVLNKK